MTNVVKLKANDIGPKVRLLCKEFKESVEDHLDLKLAYIKLRLSGDTVYPDMSKRISDKEKISYNMRKNVNVVDINNDEGGKCKKAIIDILDRQNEVCNKEIDVKLIKRLNERGNVTNTIYDVLKTSESYIDVIEIMKRKLLLFKIISTGLLFFLLLVLIIKVN